MAMNVSAQGGVKSDINITPLVDVVLPETLDPAKMPENQKQLTVSVKQDGTVFVKDNWVTNENLPATLKEIHDSNPDKTVVVKGDKRLKYKDVRKVMRLINEAGFTRVGLVMDKKNKV